MTLQKTGGHYQRSLGAEMARRCGIVKGVSNVGILQIAPPNAIKIHRLFFDYQRETARRMGARALAQMIVDSLGGWRDPADRLFVEFPFNEECQEPGDDLEWHIDLVREGVPVIEAAGLRALCFNFSVGTPKDWERAWTLLRERNYGGINRARHAIGMHAYDQAGDVDWTLYRHRLFHMFTEGDHPLIIISEAGPEKWRQIPGWNIETCAAWIERFDVEIQKDDYVIGAVLFGLGCFPPFEPFELEDVVPKLALPSTPPTLRVPTLRVPTGGTQTGGSTVSTYRLGNIDIEDLRGKLPVHPTLRYDRRPLTQIKRLVIHHSATSGNATAEQFARYHVSAHGEPPEEWPGIAYHFVITTDGRIQYTADHALVTYGVAGQNADTVHICLVGDFTDQTPGDVQLAATRSLIDNYRLAMGQAYPVYGHREIAKTKTTCPGNTWREWQLRLVNAPVGDDLAARYATLLAAYQVQTDKLRTAEAKIAAAKAALGV